MLIIAIYAHKQVKIIFIVYPAKKNQLSKGELMNSINMPENKLNDKNSFNINNVIATSICKFLNLKELMDIFSMISKEWYNASGHVMMWQSFCKDAKIIYISPDSPRNAFLKAYEKKNIPVIQTCIKIFSQNFLIPRQDNRVYGNGGYIDFIINAENPKLEGTNLAKVKLQKFKYNFSLKQNKSDEECYTILCEISNDLNALSGDRSTAKYLKAIMAIDKRTDKMTFDQADQLLQELILDPENSNRSKADAKYLRVEMLFNHLINSLSYDEGDLLLLNVLEDPSTTAQTKILSNLLRARFRCEKNVDILTDKQAYELLDAVIKNPLSTKDQALKAEIEKLLLEEKFRMEK